MEETVSGRVSWRKRKIAHVLEQLQSGDNLVVSELSRLGRSMLEYMEILSIAAQKEINIYAIKGNWRLDKSIQSKIIAMAFSMASEIERDLIANVPKKRWPLAGAPGRSSAGQRGLVKVSLISIVQRLRRYWRMAHHKSLSPIAMARPRPISAIGFKSMG